MVKIDLVTGFLGSGKTTFIRKYASFLSRNGQKVCILENDHGAINVDALLLNSLKADHIGIEMVAGGCDHDCHMRRFKTKLITMAMLGYTRVIVEPSGIFDADEFFDILHEDRVSDMYEIGSVITVVDANLEETLSDDANFLLASQAANAGCIVLSKTQLCDDERIHKTIEHVNQALKSIHCSRTFTLHETVLCKDWNMFDTQDLKALSECGYKDVSYVKHFSMDDNNFQSLFFMNMEDDTDVIIRRISEIWNDPMTGNILRIKGFLKENDSWIEINATKEKVEVSTSEIGQKIIIVIGEHLNEERIGAYFPSQYSTIQVLKEGRTILNEK